MKTKFTTVDQYIAAAAVDVRPVLVRIRAIVKSIAPRAEEVISYRIPAFRQGRVFFYFAKFELNKQSFLALNGGPHFKLNEAVSFMVNCDTQDEIDYYWEKLSHGGDPSAQRCGWLKDQFGVSWQVVPAMLPALLQGPDGTKAAAVMQALLQMAKLDIAALQRAYDSK